MRDLLTIIAGIFLVAAVVFAGYGLNTMYSYEGNYSAHVVGGDAYNFIILAARGTGLVCAGIVCGLLGNAFLLFAMMEGNRKITSNTKSVETHSDVA